MGFLVFCIIFFILFVIYDILASGAKLLKFICMMLIMGFEGGYRSKIEKDRLQDDIRIKEERQRKRQKELTDQIAKENERNFQMERNLAYGILNKVNELKFKYPYADIDLFEKYKLEFNNLTITELEQLENKIAKSHFDNINSNKSVRVNYTYKDIEFLNPLETQFEHPIEMKTYRISTDHILVIKNLETKKIFMYQSKNYISILELCNAVLNEIYRLRNTKQSIHTLNIDDIIKGVNIQDIFKSN
jgi:hypothetical protein